MSTWYLGPLGNLRALVCPDRDIDIQEVRYGGIHQGLSGARTMDVTGHRAQYSFQFSYLDQDEYQWYEALHTRLVWGPHYLINPLKRNRLTLQASNLNVSPVDKSGVRLPTGSSQELHPAYPTSISRPVRSIAFTGWSGTSGTVAFDQGKFVPVLAGERISASVYLGCSQGATHSGATLRLDWFDAQGQALAPTLSAPFSITPTWSRQALVNTTPPAGGVACRFSLGLNASNTRIYVTAPQVEAGVNTTEFEVGGASPQVLIDQLPATSPRFPMRDVTLTLLEA